MKSTIFNRISGISFVFLCTLLQSSGVRAVDGEARYVSGRKTFTVTEIGNSTVVKTEIRPGICERVANGVKSLQVPALGIAEAIWKATHREEVEEARALATELHYDHERFYPTAENYFDATLLTSGVDWKSFKDAPSQELKDPNGVWEIRMSWGAVKSPSMNMGEGLLVTLKRGEASYLIHLSPESLGLRLKEGDRSPLIIRPRAVFPTSGGMPFQGSQRSFQDALGISVQVATRPEELQKEIFDFSEIVIPLGYPGITEAKVIQYEFHRGNSLN